jgi:beta-glucosidase/6-phospho-beta-glucosidase/beta-galactosidase
LFVTLEGYAVEGGFDGPHQPSTCFRPTIALGRHVGPGDADGLWTDYEKVLDLVPALGFDGVRLTVEWARIEPRRGEVDEAALARYADVARYARSLNLGVTIVLVDTAWPAWLGMEAWLLPWVVPCMLEHARRVVGALGDVVTGVLPFADIEQFVTNGFITGTMPPWRSSATTDAAFATKQLKGLTSALAADGIVGHRIVGLVRTVPLNLSLSAMTSVRSSSSECDELHFRSLLKGSGPTSAPAGLLVKKQGAWRPHISDELRALFN